MTPCPEPWSWASSVAQGGWEDAFHPPGCLFVGVGELENGEVGVAWSNDLDPHWKSPVVETDWHARNWMTGHRPRRDCLHPPVIGIHPPACDGLRPVSRFVEREHLRTWRKNVVIGLEHLRDGRVPVVARHRPPSGPSDRRQSPER